jgi:hypothetical protein
MTITNKYEVAEMEKNTCNQGGSPSITNRWVCDSEDDAILQLHVRKVEAEIQGRTDVRFEARENGEAITGEVPDDDVIYKALAKMGYTENEILSVLQ